MDLGIIVARALHIVLGAFWVGTIVFNAVFLVPAMRDAGPDAAKVSAGLMRRGFMKTVPVVAVITILSGFWLYWKMSFGFQPEYMRSARGMMFGAGGVAAVLAFAFGIIVMRPAMMRVASLAQAAATVSDAERPAIMSSIAALRVRAARAGQLVAILLVFATLVMSIARYVG